MSTDKQWKDWGDRNIEVKAKKSYIQLFPLVVVILLVVIILCELL